MRLMWNYARVKVGEDRQVFLSLDKVHKQKICLPCNCRVGENVMPEMVAAIFPPWGEKLETSTLRMAKQGRVQVPMMSSCCGTTNAKSPSTVHPVMWNNTPVIVYIYYIFLFATKGNHNYYYTRSLVHKLVHRWGPDSPSGSGQPGWMGEGPWVAGPGLWLNSQTPSWGDNLYVCLLLYRMFWPFTFQHEFCDHCSMLHN